MPNIWLIGVFGKEDEESSGKTIKDKVPNSPSKLTGEANLSFNLRRFSKHCTLKYLGTLMWNIRKTKIKDPKIRYKWQIDRH